MTRGKTIITRSRALVAGGVVIALAAALLVWFAVRPSSTPSLPNTRIELGHATRHPATQTRPNILVIEADDMRWDDLRWMPNVKRLIMKTGLDFQNSFAPYPLCCPSRASFMTGKYAHNHHVYSHSNPWGFHAFNDKVTIGTQLQKAGYKTALIGKYLNGYGQQPTHGTNKPSLHYVPPGWTQWRAGSDHLWPKKGTIHGNTYNYYRLVQNINGRIKQWPGQYSTDVLARQTRTYIDRWSIENKPWFIWFTPIAPHFGAPIEPDDPKPTVATNGHVYNWFTPARPNWVKGWFDKDITHGLGTPPNHPAEADISDKPHYLRVKPEEDPAERAAETTLTRQRAESLLVLDVEVGKTLKRLRALGEMKNTIIVFTSDNGYYLGEHRKRDGKLTLHEPSLRVPFLITGPGIPHGQRFDPITTIDVAPTLASYAGTTMPDADGLNLRSIITGGDKGWFRPVVTEARMSAKRYTHGRDLPGSPLNVRGLRLGRWKYTKYSTGEEELYDLKTDPLEMNSLQDVPAARPMLLEMRRLFKKYENCKQAQCYAPLPKRFQLTPAQEKAITVAEIRRTDTYYGNLPISAPAGRDAGHDG